MGRRGSGRRRSREVGGCAGQVSAAVREVELQQPVDSRRRISPDQRCKLKRHPGPEETGIPRLAPAVYCLSRSEISSSVSGDPSDTRTGTRCDSWDTATSPATTPPAGSVRRIPADTRNENRSGYRARQPARSGFHRAVRILNARLSYPWVAVKTSNTRTRRRWHTNTLNC